MALTRAPATRTVTSRTRTGTTASSTSIGTTPTTGTPTCGLAWKYHEGKSPAGDFFRSRYASHPEAIFDASMTFSCRKKYFFSSNISSSWHSRISLLLTANAMRSSFIGRIFAGGSASAASIDSFKQVSIVFSTRAYNPNLSRLGIFLPV